MTKLLNQLQNNAKQKIKSFAVLIDPDKITNESMLLQVINRCVENDVDYIFVGGSLLLENSVQWVVDHIKENCSIPVVLFPGDCTQVYSRADGILFLSLISGRNPEYLIGQHVKSAMSLKKSGVEILPTGYCLIESGKTTSVEYISNTTPIPSNKVDIAVSTAVAAELLGMQLIYLEAGSGAQSPVPIPMIAEVKKHLELPIIVGGGINTPKKAEDALTAGADLLVIGNGIEKNPDLMTEVSNLIQKMNYQLDIHQ